MGWFDHELNKLGADAERLTSGAQHLAGHVLDDGAHGVGDVLSAAGLGGAAGTVDRAGDDVANDLGDQIPEKQLGQTTDPVELVHGDQGALTRAAGKLKEFSAAFGTTADGLAGIDTAHWTGQAAAAFRARYAPQPGCWQDASSACGRAASALVSYAQTVEWAQGQAQQAIEVYQQGQQATATARAAYAQQVSAYNQAAQVYDSRLASGSSPGMRPTEPGSFTDPGEGLRARAQQILTQARQQRDQAAAQAQSRITTATELAPAEPSFTQRMLGGVSDLYQADQLASVSFADGALQGTADIVKLVRSLNPDDPWNWTHLAEYAGGLSATGTALAHDALHPGALAEGLAGSGWSSDPAEALGRLVPNVALAVGTDGAGTVADVGESVTERVAVDSGEAGLRDAAADPASAARSSSDMTLQGDPVDVASGDVILGQADVRLAGTLPLVVERAHRSSYRAGRWFGRSWASTFDQRLEIAADGAFFAVADGVVLAYPLPGQDGGPVLPASGARWPLAREADGSYTVTDPQAGRVWRFASRSGYFVAESGRGELPLISVTDRAGHQIAFSYDEEGTPAAISHDGGYQVRVAAAGGRITALHLTGTGRGGGDVMLARYGYDGAGNLSEIINSSGRPLRLSYDDAGRLTGWEDRNGWAYRYGYDADGRCVRAEGPGGMLSGTFSYDRDNLVTRYTDAAGAMTVYQLSERSQVVAETDPMGNVTRQEHDEYGRLLARADPLGRVTRYSYDQAGNLTAITRPDGTRAVAEYGELNLAALITEPGGAQWRQEFDPAGNRIRLTDPAGACTESSYDQRGHLASITDPAGAKTRMQCDAAGLPVAITAPDGALTRYERDGFGQITGITGPDGSVTRLSWTTEGRLASRTFPDGATERYGHDGEGNLTAHVDPAAGLTRTEYTCFDQVAARTGPDGARIEFGYDTALRLTTVTIPDGSGGLTWRYDYDPAGRLAAETDFNGAVTRYAHDAAGQLTGQVNGAAQQVSYRYDLLGNVTERCADNVVTRYGYDDAGRLVQAAKPDADLRLDRDALGRVTAETCNGRTVRSAYDAAGRRVRRVTSTGAETTWDYDRSGRPLLLQAAGQSIRFGYDEAGRETARQLPGGATLAQQWDPASRLASQVLTGAAGLPFPRNGAGVRAAAGAGDGTAEAGKVLQRRAYRYRSDGCLAGVEDLLAGARRFGLDPAGRVTGVSGPGWAESYRYDLAGNITAAAWPAPPGSVRGAGTQGPRQYAGTLIRSAGSVRYRHDGQGRVIVRQQVRLSRKPDTWQYTWDAGDRLVALVTPDGTRWRYIYDPLGRRIAKQRLAGDGTVAEQTRFTWDGATLAEQVTGIREPGGQPGPGQVTTWDYQPGTFTPVTQTERTWLRGAPQHEIDQRFYAVVTDLIGTPSELIAPDGSMAGYQQHTLWGTIIWKPGGAASPLRFPGQYHDPETGLHYNNQRYYDPATARYLSPDPLGLAPAPNPHTYVPNPTRQTDPLGLTACGPGGNDNPGAALTRVGRWMSPEEHQSMLDTGMVQPGRTGVINVAHPADIQSYIRQALPGNRYVEFDIPESSLVQGGKVGWATIPGPDSIFSRLNISRGLAPYEFPPALNVKWLASKLPLW